MKGSLSKGIFLTVIVLMVAACGKNGPDEKVGNDDPNQQSNHNAPDAGPDDAGPSGFFVADDGETYTYEVPTKVLVDASRSGVVDFEDPKDVEHRFDADEGFGALFLANLDDDAGQCNGLNDDEAYESCYDARNFEVASEADLADMARIQTKPTGVVSPETVGVLDVNEDARRWVRLYKRGGEGNGADSFVPYEPGEDVVDAEALEQGVEFAIEGKALVNQDEGWDGVVELKWEIEVGEVEHTIEDYARMEQAPVIFPHHLHPAKEVYVADLGNSNADFVADLQAATDAAGVEKGLRLLDLWDPWVQDYMLTGYMAIPAPEGPQVVRMYFRSANLNHPESAQPIFHRLDELEGYAPEPLLREAGQVVFSDFHGPGVAGRAEYDGDKGFEPVSLDGVDIDDALAYIYGQPSQHEYPEIAQLVSRVFASDTLDSFGNTETVPPHIAPDGTAYPHGRVVRGQHLGNDNIRPDPTLTSIIDSQGAQPVLWVDTYWKLVAHVDETISFVESDTDRGWSLLYNDPVRAKEMLETLRDEQGGGDLIMFEGKSYPSWWGSAGGSAEVTVNEVLNDTEIMEASARAAIEINAQLDIFRDEVGIVDDDLIPIAFLHEDYGQGSLAYQPGIINGISLKPDVFGAADPHGPEVDGDDIFKLDVEDLLGAVGVEVHWIETWDVYHVGVGQVHCGSNVIRHTPTTPWWAKEMN